MTPEKLVQHADAVRRAYRTQRKLERLDRKVSAGHSGLVEFRNRTAAELEVNNLPNGPEQRAVAFTDVDLSPDGTLFRGYAAVFDAVADLGRFTESIARGAFRKALATGRSVPMLWNHNDQIPPVATTGGGTLRLKEDGKGLLVEADVARHFVGDALREMVSRGDVRGMSFGFVAGPGNSRLGGGGGKPHRSLVGFEKLLDVSLTHDPAYAGTEAAFRSLVGGVPVLSGLYELEDWAAAAAKRRVQLDEMAKTLRGVA